MDLTLPRKHTASDTTIFSVMSALAQAHNAINLSQGFPDFPIDYKLSDYLMEACQTGMNQYAPMPGLPILREAIAADLAQRYAVAIDPQTELTITPGATYAIYTAFSAILSPGDEVIVLEPAYDSYIPNIEMNGAKVVSVKLDTTTFTPDWQKIKDAISRQTKAIIINTPHNPSGAIWTKDDWYQLTELVSNTNIYILSDEVYDQLVYDNAVHHTVLQFPVLRERSFALFSFGKSLHNTGWKIGYCIAPPALTHAFRRLHQFLSFSVHTPAQYAIAQYLQDQQRTPAHKLLQSKRDYFIDLMAQTPFRIVAPAQGSYFQLVTYAHLSDLPDTEFATMLTKQYGVASIPISAFYSDRQDDKILRFCFAKQEETLEKAVARLAQVKQT